MNSIGKLLRLTTFGESHGPSIGGILDGFPPLIAIDMEFVQNELNRRRPGQSVITSSRKEKDTVEFISGIFNGISTGAPIAFIVKNHDQQSADYESMKNIFRPSHADYTYLSKYGIRDHKGGGRASARTTIAQCVGGALAKLALKQLSPDLEIFAFTSQIGGISVDPAQENKFSHCISESNAVRCPDRDKAKIMEELIKQTKENGDSIGGVITCLIRDCPVGLGEPMFNKLSSSLGAAMLSINAVKGFEYGDGFASAEQTGSIHNDQIIIKNGKLNTLSNHSGGIQGGISNGETIRFRVAFKPTPTIIKEQKTVTTTGQETIFKAKGRHDQCVVPRAVPIVENLAALVLLDHFLIRKAYK